MAAHIKSMLEFRRNRNGAMAMQCLVRKFLAKRRVARIRLRRLHKLIFRYVTVIQCMIRRFICRARVQHKRIQVRADREAAEAMAAQRRAEEAAAAEAAETKQLLESVDLFLQANAGNTTGVVDIYTGLASTEEHNRDETEPGTGDNLLTIAARLGNLDLVRKCLLWGFDLNVRNDMGFNALMVAAKHNHLPVMQYLLAPQVGTTDTPYTPLDPISEEDAGFLLVTAAANAVIADDLSMLVKVLSLGVDVNAKNAATGMTAVHAACEVGHVEAFKLLVKHKADLEVEDDLGQTPLHKACCNSFKITELILGLDPTFSTYMSDATRAASIMKVDGDGKDCILHAALNGQTDTLDLLTGSLQTGLNRSKSGKFNAADLATSEEIGWSPNDITKALRLVETGNLTCLNKIASIGFDVSWAEEETGRTLAIAACQSGDTDMVDMLMSLGVDFAVADATGRTPVHYAAECSGASLLPHLLMHANSAKCNISDASLLVVDQKGENVFHIAARCGNELKIDLLAQRVLKQALEARNNAGQTPILVACYMYKLDVVKAYLRLGADALAGDSDGHDCLWHLLHPSQGPARRPLCSEYMLHPSSTATPGAPVLSRRERDEEMARVATEISLFTALLRAGSVLYADRSEPISPDSLRAKLAFQWNETPTAVAQIGFQCGDVIVQEISITLLKTLLSEGLLNPYDAWRILVAAFWFDDGSAKTITALFKAGIIEALTGAGGSIGDSEQDSSVALSKLSMSALANASTSENFPLHRLQDQYFSDLTLLGWAIQLGRPKVLQYFLKRNYKHTLPVDAEGNPALHFVAMHGTAEMADMIIADKNLRLEQANRAGWTAAMVAVKRKNFGVAKKLFDARADCRRSLDGAYAAWVLAFVRRREKNEVNTQTGRYGDDDTLYFDISPDPFYVTWYAYS